MTTTDEPLSIDKLLKQPIYGRGWVIGAVNYVDKQRRECAVWDRTDAPVVVEFRSEDEAAVCAAFEQSDEQSLKVLGQVEHWSGGRITRVLEVERLFVIPRSSAEHPTAKDLWDDLKALTDKATSADLPSNLSKDHDRYIAESITREFDLND